MIYSVIFDLDGTLVDTGDLFYDVFSTYLREIRLAAVDFSRKGNPYASAHRQTVSRYPHLNPLVAQKGFLETWENVLRKALRNRHVLLFPAVRETLTALRNMKMPLFIYSNTPRGFVRMKLHSLDIEGFFEEVYAPVDAADPLRKPDVTPLREIADRYGIAPEQLCIVGDHVTDIMCGKNLGTVTVGVLNSWNQRELHDIQPDYTIREIRETLSVIGRSRKERERTARKD